MRLEGQVQCSRRGGTESNPLAEGFLPQTRLGVLDVVLVGGGVLEVSGEVVQDLRNVPCQLAL